MKNISTRKIIVTLAVLEALVLIPTIIYFVFYK